MSEPCIVSCRILTALGNLTETWNNLFNLQTGLKLLAIDGFKERCNVGLIESLEGKIGSYPRLTSLMDQGLASGFELLANDQPIADCIVTTTKGAADELINPSPAAWQGQPWQIGEMVKKHLPCNGSPRVVSAACASGTIGLIQAAIQIEKKISTAVVVVGIEIISRFVVAGFDSLQALSPDRCRPFDRDRDGLSLGEGIGIILVTSKELATRNGWPILARISGWGASCDAIHITAPCRKGSGLRRVLLEATDGGKVMVGGINAHGTGTRYNDAMELSAMRSIWKTIPPVHSVKGAIGHCLGAAGVIEASIGIMSLQEKQIPPTVGYKIGEDDDLAISGSKPLPLKSSSILSCNAGFGGINAGILLTENE